MTEQLQEYMDELRTWSTEDIRAILIDTLLFMDDDDADFLLACADLLDERDPLPIHPDAKASLARFKQRHPEFFSDDNN